MNAAAATAATRFVVVVATAAGAAKKTTRTVSTAAATTKRTRTAAATSRRFFFVGGGIDYYYYYYYGCSSCWSARTAPLTTTRRLFAGSTTTTTAASTVVAATQQQPEEDFRPSSSTSSDDDDDDVLSPLAPAEESEQRQQRQPKQRQRQLRRRRLDVAIVGLPNAGKSQLLNALTNSPASISAVSRKRHTTRRDVLGARTLLPDERNDGTQLLFKDTPGFLRAEAQQQQQRQRRREPKHREEDGSTAVAVGSGAASALRAASTSTSETDRSIDHTLLVVDAARRLTREVRETLVELIATALRRQYRQQQSSSYDDDPEREGESPTETANPVGDSMPSSSSSSSNWSVVLNKVDLVHPKTDLLDLAEEIGAMAEECILYLHDRTTTRRRLEIGGGGAGDDGAEEEGKDDVAEEGDEEGRRLELQRVVEENFPMFFYVSALKNDQGVDDLLRFLVDRALPCTSWEMEPGEVTDQTPEQRVEEVIREKIYRCLHKEVPYNIRQNNKLFQVVKEKRTGQPGVLIHQELVVTTKSHRDLVRGPNGGQTLERIRETSQRDLEKILGCKVVLQLFVKLLKTKQVRNRNWSE